MLKLKPTEADKFNKDQSRDQFKSSLIISVILHASIVFLFLIKFIFFSKPIIDLSEAINVHIEEFPEDSQKLPGKNEAQKNEPNADDNKLPEKIEHIKVDQPAKSQAEVKPERMDAVEKNKQVKMPEKESLKEVVSKDSINLNKIKQKEALSKLKKISALEKIKQDLKNESLDKIKSTDVKINKPDRKSRIIAAGSAITGLDKIQVNNYLRDVDQSVKQFWALPQWLMNKPFKAQALVKFNIFGEILSVKIVSSSGNSSYDQYCLQAIEKAAPFPKVPEKLSEKFSVDGIIIGFPE